MTSVDDIVPERIPEEDKIKYAERSDPYLDSPRGDPLPDGSRIWTRRLEGRTQRIHAHFVRSLTSLRDSKLEGEYSTA